MHGLISLVDVGLGDLGDGHSEDVLWGECTESDVLYFSLEALLGLGLLT